MRLFFVFLFIAFCLTFQNSAKAQDGCLVPGVGVYTQQEGSLVNAILGLILGPGYKGSPIDQYGACISNSQTVYVPNNSKNCRVCIGGGFTIVIPGVLVTCGTTEYAGKVATPNIVFCNLDEYTWAFGASGAALGIIVIRKRMKK